MAECALEDEVFEDGAETQMECNKCVCACGSWVCTALTCNGETGLIIGVTELNEVNIGGFLYFRTESGRGRCESRRRRNDGGGVE